MKEVSLQPEILRLREKEKLDAKEKQLDARQKQLDAKEDQLLKEKLPSSDMK